jgi:putative FmdB family regulatory protein
MPLYEYQCSQCGNIEEVIQKFSDRPLAKCKHCSGKLHKLISHSAFHLKGSGWYVTDYANKSKTSSSKSHKTESAPADSGQSKDNAGGSKDSAS